MNVFEHFSCHTLLPVKLSDVMEHVLEAAASMERPTRRIEVWGDDLDTSLVRGYLLVTDDELDGKSERVARIVYAKTLSLPWRRVILCKELLHVLDGHADTDATREAISQQITEVCAPWGASLGLLAHQDRVGLGHALVVLMPRDLIHFLRPHYEAGQINDAALANFAQIPESVIPLVMSKSWEAVIELAIK